jgi:hypothetical protein
VDPVRAIGEIARRHGAFLHVDAAWAGSAAIVPEFRAAFDGLELADSVVMNPHKWLGVNFDCSLLFIRDLPAWLETFSLTPEYLKSAHDADVVNYRDWGIPLGRRFRALKLWFVLRSEGAETLRAESGVRASCSRRGRGDPASERMAPASLLRLFRQWLADAGIRADDHNRRLWTGSTGANRPPYRHCVGQIRDPDGHRATKYRGTKRPGGMGRHTAMHQGVRA